MADDVSTAPPTMVCRADVRPWEDLRASGLLWLINRQVFHPRGYALGVVYLEGQVAGWQILGDGRKPWRYTDDTDEAALLAAAQATLTERAKSDDEDREASQARRLLDQAIDAALPLAGGRVEELLDTLRRELARVDDRRAEPMIKPAEPGPLSDREPPPPGDPS